MKRHNHHQSVGARRAVPFDVAGAVAKIIGCFKRGHGAPCPYGGGGQNCVRGCATGAVDNPFLHDGGHQKRYVNPRCRGTAGFTLVELVVVIVIVGILSALGGRFIVAPITGYVDLSRRTRLVDQAEMSLRRMQRDIRHALPNSIRIDTSGQYLEMLNTVDGGRYRRYPDPTTGGDILDFTMADSGFDVLGTLSQVPASNDSLVVYNISSTGINGNAYVAASANRAIVGAGSTATHINLIPSYDFANSSPYQRFFVVDQPVTYACEGGVLNRYDGYAISEVQVTPPAGGGADLVARNIADCQFSYNPGASQRAGLVTLKLSLSEAGETITLLHQVHVVNVP